MIIERKCKICGQVIRANGELKFKRAFLNHFVGEHKAIYDERIAKRNEANERFKALKKEYPNLGFSFSRFELRYELETDMCVAGK